MIDTIRHNIQEVFGNYDRHVPADVIQRLFVSIPSDETTLTQEIMGYLLAHNYEALQTPQGGSLREQLISTDWRQKEAKKWVPEPEPLVLPVTTDVATHPIAIPFSQSNKVLIAFVILFVSILLWLWKGKLSAIDDEGSRLDTTEQEFPAKEPVLPVGEVTDGAATKQTTRKTALGSAPVAPVINAPNQILVPVSAPQSPANSSPEAAVETNSYDTVDEHVGDFGLRAARKGNKWGYIDQKNQWQIEPLYDDVTPFQSGKAIVILDGQQISIDRDGARIREVED
ncbi:hypothetical protein GCM10027347_28810 [Larkinella harenae]